MTSSVEKGRGNRDVSASDVPASSSVSSSSLRVSAGSILRGRTTPRSSQSSASSRSTNIFRTFFAQRNADYRAANVSRSTMYQGTPRSPAVRRPSSGRSSPPPEHSEYEEKTKCSCCECLSPSPGFLNVLSRIIWSRLWRVIIVFNSILLLFGSEIQDLWIPPNGDTVMDVLYCIALAVFTMDMIMRCYLEPKYVSVPRCRKKEHAQNSAWGRLQLGSFLFWCDLLSTLTLLYNMSFINTKAFEITGIDITLNRIGIPEEGLDDVNKAIPVSTNYGVLILIGRTARVARFIQRTTFKRANSKYNAYWFVTRFNPLWYLDRYRQKRSAQVLNEQGSTRSMGNSTEHETKRSSRRISRSTSWGTLQMAIMAKTRGYENEQEKPRGIRGITFHALRKVGLLRNTKHEEFRRQLAATKIQRAWRATVAQSPEVGNDVAWVGQRGSVRSTVAAGGKKKHHLWRTAEALTSSRHSTQSSTRGRRPESQVGSAMRELTAQRVAVGIIIALTLTVLFTYAENDATRPSSMIVLHNQTANEDYAAASLQAARESSIPDLYQYTFASGEEVNFTVSSAENPADLREREKVRITVKTTFLDTSGVKVVGNETIGLFAYRSERRDQACVEICSTLFILCIWLFGVTAFAGPVMTLVVIPIERMVRLLGMLMMDPLGYQSTSRYKKFVAEGDEITKNTQWTKEQLKGMETSFLMSTILRIGSLMKVGFGSAGVEIIRNNLETGQSKNMLILNSQGSTVFCIFLFCDIRQFTDATECLQEEVFVFTNRIAGVVHSICHSYGGSANKNVGDAFLLTWLLDDGSNSKHDPDNPRPFDRENSSSSDTFTAKYNQADKALLSVVKISIALNHDQHYLEPLSESARKALLTKLSKRKGPVVQMGFGLHAGKAVQGAIGSQRKIDATYVSESVERAEFLESSTKKYGIRMLMSDSFHRLLDPSNRRRCRKIDQILLQGEDDDDEDAPVDEGDFMELFTFDMDIDALWRPVPKSKAMSAPTAIGGDDHVSDSDSLADSNKGCSRRDLLRSPSVRGGGLLNLPRRRSIRHLKSSGKHQGDDGSEEITKLGNASADVVAAGNVMTGGIVDTIEEAKITVTPELILPTGPALYNANVWLSDDMRRIRQLYSDGLFFQTWNSGFTAYYAKDWEHATQCFQTILERFDDGPSRYFLKCIKDNYGVPPRDFRPYGLA